MPGTVTGSHSLCCVANRHPETSVKDIVLSVTLQNPEFFKNKDITRNRNIYTSFLTSLLLQ